VVDVHASNLQSFDDDGKTSGDNDKRVWFTLGGAGRCKNLYWDPTIAASYGNPASQVGPALLVVASVLLSLWQ
jgi:hypothetical protein